MDTPEPTNQAERKLWQRYVAARGDTPSECVSSEQLAAYLDARLDEGERTVVEDHLAECAACREAVRDVRSIGLSTTIPLVPREVLESARGLVGRRTRPAEESRRRWRIADWRAAGGWGLGAAASIAICFVGYQAGAGFGLGRTIADERLLSEVSFGLLSTAAPGPDFEMVTIMLGEATP